MLATYMRRMRNNNLEIRIAGSSYRPQWHVATRCLTTNDQQLFRKQNVECNVSSLKNLLIG